MLADLDALVIALYVRIDDFLPRSSALQASFYALHELIGEFYYRLRY